MPTPKSPYDNIPEDQRIKLQAMVPECDKFLIQSVFPQRGILLFAVESFIYALANDLRKHGLTYYSPDNADALISLIRQRTDPGLTDNRSDKVVIRTTPGIRSAIEDPKVVASNLHESPEGRIGRSGGGKSNKKVKSS